MFSIDLHDRGRAREEGVDGAWKKNEDRAAMALEGKKQEGLADGGEALVAVRGKPRRGQKKKRPCEAYLGLKLWRSEDLTSLYLLIKFGVNLNILA